MFCNFRQPPDAQKQKEEKELEIEISSKGTENNSTPAGLLFYHLESLEV